MRLFFVVFAALVASKGSFASEEKPKPLVAPVYSFAPNYKTDLKAQISIANWANGAAVKITQFAADEALDRATLNAMKAAAPEAGKMLMETGAPGVLLEARYVRDTSVTNPDSGPSDLRTVLEGNRLHIVGAGRTPRDVLLIEQQKPSIDFSHEKNQEYVSEMQKDYWITNGSNGRLSIAKVDSDALRRSVVDVTLNDGLFEQMKAAIFRNALSDVIRAAERNATSRDAQRAAEKLIQERDDAIGKLMKVDADLRRELEKAKQANNDADKFALAAALAGAGSSIVQASETSDKGSGVKAKTTTKQISTPSGVILEQIKQRVEIEGKVILSDQQIGAFIEKEGKVKYIPLYNGK